jgi:cytoskeleton-associated protein 5
MYKIIGSDIKLLIKNIKESTLKNIYKEMEKIDIDISQNNSNQNNTLNSPIKPTDISKLIPPKLLKEIDKGKWQEKKDGIDYILNAIENGNKKILPDGLKDLFDLIKEKLSDANKNFVRLIIQLLSSLIISLGENIKTYSREFALPLL